MLTLHVACVLAAWCGFARAFGACLVTGPPCTARWRLVCPAMLAVRVTHRNLFHEIHM